MMKTKNMRWLVLPVLLFVGTGSLSAQSVRQDEQEVLRKTDGGVYNVYDADAPKVITPVPDGYTVTGISHYGRHGSRYCTDSYRETASHLEEMHQQGILSERGEQVYESFKALVPSLAGREGELVQLGRRQHQGIAARMYRNHPALFTTDANLSARSTLVPRCIESMGAFCEQLARLCPEVEIPQEASMYYLGEVSAMQEYVYFYDVDYKKQSKQLKKEWEKKILHTDSFREMLCGDKKEDANHMRDLARQLRNIYLSLPYVDDCDARAVEAFRYAIDGVSGTETGMRPVQVPLFDDETWRQLGDVTKSRHLVEAYYPTLHHSVMNIFMIDRIMRMVDEDLAAGKPFVRLRFGHDTILMATLKDFGVRGWRVWEACDTLTQEQAMWKTLGELSMSRIPMAANLQMVFYRRDKDSRQFASVFASSQNAPEVLFKMLLNESELELPIPAVCGRIYDWSVFKAYMAPRIEKGKSRAQPFLKYPYPIPRQ